MIESTIKSIVCQNRYNILSTCRLPLFIRHCTTSKSVKPSWLTWPEEHLDEESTESEEMQKKRNKARLPERVYQAHILKQMPSLGAKYSYEKRYLRRMYAMHGKSSGLNPGIMWPTKQELLECIEEDKLYPSLQEMVRNVKEKRLQEARVKREREEFVEQNMAKVETFKKEYFNRLAKKEAEAKELQEKQEKKIAEVCEFLGYNVSPNDPRFQEALEQKEKEEKKALKEMKKKLLIEKERATVAGMVEEVQKNETKEKKKLKKSVK